MDMDLGSSNLNQILKFLRTGQLLQAPSSESLQLVY